MYLSTHRLVINTVTKYVFFPNLKVDILRVWLLFSWLLCQSWQCFNQTHAMEVLKIYQHQKMTTCPENKLVRSGSPRKLWKVLGCGMIERFRILEIKFGFQAAGKKKLSLKANSINLLLRKLNMFWWNS